MISSQPLIDPQNEGRSPPIPLIAMTKIKLTSFETFYLILTRMLYHCGGIDKRYFEKCEALAREFRGHFTVTPFHYMWRESGHRDEIFDFLYSRMRGQYDMGVLYENTKKLKSLMKISMMSDAHILVVTLNDYEGMNYRPQDKKEYLEDLRENILISKMSVKHFMIFVSVGTYDKIEYLDDLMQNIQNNLKEFSMQNIRIICIRESCNFTNENALGTKIHPLFSSLTVQAALLEFRNEILQDFKSIEINDDENLVFSIMDKKKIGGAGTTMIGRVLSGSIREAQGLIITNPILSEVRSLEIFHEKQSTVHKGDFCGVALRNISMGEIERGSLFGIAPTQTFEAIVYISHSPTRGWKAGVTPTVYSTCVREPCRVIEILERLSKKTKATLVSKPTIFKVNELVRLRFTCSKGIQLLNDPRWGKIILVHNNKVMGGGFISSVN